MKPESGKASTAAPALPATGSPTEVFAAFLKLGLTSFGGPVAHLGYFRDELVTRRHWIDEAGYADLVALCQFLPGPASSQVGFALGLMRAGPLGALAAWTAFTLPSALLLIAFAGGLDAFGGPLGSGLLHGFKLAAVAVVAQAVWGMARTLTPDATRAGIAVLALLVVTLAPGSAGQMAALTAGGLAGLWLCRNAPATAAGHLPSPVSKRAGAISLVLFVLLLVLSALATTQPYGMYALFGAFYRSGALVFGGGHVVLPLLEAEVVRTGWLGADTFLAGYGAAQAVPGPLFTFAAYLGAAMQTSPSGITGAAVALGAIFLPGLLLVVGVLPFWTAVRTRPGVAAGMRGANAAVVGLLGAALYHPVWTGAVFGPLDAAIAVAAFVLLVAWRTPPWIVVVLTALSGLLPGAGL